jgi:hypothetical protein
MHVTDAQIRLSPLRGRASFALRPDRRRSPRQHARTRRLQALLRIGCTADPAMHRRRYRAKMGERGLRRATLDTRVRLAFRRIVDLHPIRHCCCLMRLAPKFCVMRVGDPA